jgi:hypothetical protein
MRKIRHFLARDQQEFVVSLIEQEAELQLWILFALMNGRTQRPADCR